ncbi:M28 family peptidase [Lipingzhangella sp. LS1_29]|uniref:M28 family peptidase n=1 Tax=Lipingzhangella rawalii TaxID=2055835 RepID=A0ABU2H589_9ACTN|nr:M28 family peptidase [Lipingzhangella rawalii]MDS1270478.1 M28 family peptidase [Lipingzhangella rawalii]
MTGALALVTATTVPAQATTGDLEHLVRGDNVYTHLENLQTIADFNDDTRAHGTDGYDISAMYVVDQLEKAGYEPEEHYFDFESWEEHSEATFAQTAPKDRDFVLDEDFLTMTYSAAGEVTASGVPVNAESSDSACAADDFADFPEGAIAIAQRGECTFAQKTQNAADAGAEAIIIFNHGEGDAGTGLFAGTLSEPGDIPSLSASDEVGALLLDAGEELELSVRVDASVTEDTGYSILAETEGGADDNVVMVGAHLDSVAEGPGINDNGSGTAAVLETAIQQARLDEPNNKLRFAFWGAEELGLVGSSAYVDDLSDQELDDLALYLNFDMVGSPNFGRFIYDGKGEHADSQPSPVGSAAIHRMFENYFEDRDLFAESSPMSSRSDHFGFMQAGIPVGGVHSGVDAIKTEEQADIYGGEAGQPFDPNYHTAADDLDNINEEVLGQLSNGIAHATETYGESTLPVNGVVQLRHDVAIEPERVGDLWVR